MKLCKLCIIICCVFIVTSCNNSDILFRNKVFSCRNKAMKADYLSYTIFVSVNGSPQNTITVYRNKKDICVCFGGQSPDDYDFNFYRLNKVQYTNISGKREDFIVFNENYKPTEDMGYKNWYYLFSNDFNGINYKDLYFEYWDKTLEKDLQYATDTIIDNIFYKLFFVKNKEYNITYYYNIKKKLFDRVEYNSIGSCDTQRYEYKNFSLKDNRDVIASLFSIDNPRWAKFTKCNGTILPTSRVIFTEDKDTVITDIIKKFPLVNINNDTTTIAQQDGWLFLFCWCYSCVPCVEFAEKLQQEKQQYGQTVLENNGIKIMCLNYHAADIEKLKNFVKPYKDVSNVFFGAKGINKYLRMTVLPTYYLISPDKKTVYFGTGKIKSYDTILKRKAEYEKRK